METIIVTKTEYLQTLLGDGNLWAHWDLNPGHLRNALLLDADRLMRRGARPMLHALGGNRSRVGS